MEPSQWGQDWVREGTEAEAGEEHTQRERVGIAGGGKKEEDGLGSSDLDGKRHIRRSRL